MVNKQEIIASYKTKENDTNFDFNKEEYRRSYKIIIK